MENANNPQEGPPPDKPPPTAKPEEPMDTSEGGQTVEEATPAVGAGGFPGLCTWEPAATGGASTVGEFKNDKVECEASANEKPDEVLYDEEELLASPMAELVPKEGDPDVILDVQHQDEELDENELIGQAPAAEEIVRSYPIFQEQHPRYDHYLAFSEEEKPKEMALKILAGWTIERIQAARNATIAAIHGPSMHFEVKPKSERSGPRKFLEVVPEDLVGTPMVVVHRNTFQAIATPVYRETVFSDRPDLHHVAIRDWSEDFLSKTHTRIDELFIGDVVIVTEVYRREDREPEDWMRCFEEVGFNDSHFFVCKSFCVLPREIRTEVPMENCRESLRKSKNDKDLPNHYNPLVAFGVPRLLLVQQDKMRGAKKGAMGGNVFVPAVQPGQLLRTIRPGQSRQRMIQETAPFRPHWHAHPSVCKWTDRTEEHTRMLDAAPLTYEKIKKDDKASLRALAFAATFGMYGEIALEARNVDRRQYLGEVKDVQDRQVTLELDCVNPPSLHQWRRGAALAVEDVSGNCFHASLVSAERITSSLHLVALLNQGSGNISPQVLLNSTCHVRQLMDERGHLARMAPSLKYAPQLSAENHAIKALAALHGGRRIPHIEVPAIEQPVTHGILTLSEEQAKIVKTIEGNGFSSLVLDCAFGTGKTTTAVLGVLRRSRKQKGVSVITGMANSAARAAYDTLVKLDKEDPIRAVRLISRDNQAKIPQEYTTPIDFPNLWTTFFAEEVHQQDRKRGRLVPEVVEAGAHLHRRGLLTLANLRREDFKKAILNVTSKAADLVRLFLSMYQPRLLLGTIASINSLLAGARMEDFRESVELILIDEASQLPRYALIALCQKFPMGRPVLVGDRRQLAPFARDGLPQVLKDYAIGSVLSDALEDDRWPALKLTRVHRCPSEITNLLSDLFYESALMSANEGAPYQAELKRAELPFKYPIVFINHEYDFHEDGPSIVCPEEAKAALRIAARIHDANPKWSIAILSYYAGTNAMVQRLAPKYVTATTVDGSQGKEYDAVIILTSRNLGSLSFLENKNRLNVAVSRTKAVCVVFGSKNALKHGANWAALLDKLPSGAITSKFQ